MVVGNKLINSFEKENSLLLIQVFALQFKSFDKQSNKYQLMTTPSYDFFSQLCTKVSNKLYFEQLMIKQQEFFDIQPYKIDKLYAQSAKKLYRQICTKYEVTKELTVEENLWHQNQRKIFIWFVVCYFHQIGAQDPIEVDINWQNFSHIFFYKSSTFLKFQFLNIIKLKKRIIWTTEEDDLLAKATEQQGIGKWNQISKALFFNSPSQVFKSPKHCRQRWLNHLDRNKNKGKWTDQEDYKILSYTRENGKKWSKIVQVLNHTRTEHMIKNRFNSLLTKNRKNKKQRQSQTVTKIIKILQKQLHLSPSSQHSVVYEDYEDNLSQENLQYGQQQEQSLLGNQINHSDEINECLMERPSQMQPRISMERKASFQMCSFETMALWQSFSTLYESCLIKNDQIINFTNPFAFISSLPQLSQKQQFATNCPIELSPQPIQLISNNSTQISKVVYKTCPVYIIQGGS